MKIIITMAGRGQRFRDVGYDCPKFKIESKGRSLFEWSMLSLSDFFSHDFIFIVRAEDSANQFISEICEKLQILNFYIVDLPSITDGQATTVLAALSIIKPEDQIAIYNIDTYILPLALRANAIKGAGFIPGFEAVGDKWSFIKLDSSLKVTEVAEKKQISSIATLGFYYFESFELYKNYYTKTFADGLNLVNGERYIAEIYRIMLIDGLPVYGEIIDANKIWALGTPDDLKYFQSEYE